MKLTKARKIFALGLFLLLTAVGVMLFMPVVLFSMGSHEETVELYTIRVPFGWATMPLPTSEADETTALKKTSARRGIIVYNNLWASTCTMQILSPADLAQEQEESRKAFSRDRKFPELPFRVKLPAELNLTPVTHLKIDEIPFERIAWSSEIGRSHLQGFELRSFPRENGDTIRFDANSGFNGPFVMDQAEYVIMSLRRKK